MTVVGTDRPLLGHDSRLRLLVIEDSTSDGELVMALLESELPHAEVCVVASLEDALRRLEEASYDAAFADLCLPDADGQAVVYAVRAAHPETALLVLTGRLDEELALWALAEGAQDYLIKGQHDGPHLATALLHALQRQRTKQEAHRYLELARGLLDALEAPTCAVGSDSTILAVNAAWRGFTAANGGDPEGCGEGQSYLLACTQRPRVRTDPADALIASAVAEGLRSVLDGSLDRFQHEYPCDSPSEKRWFTVRIAPAEIDGARGAVISHVDITAMHHVQQELSHQALHDSLTDLPNRVLLADRLGQALADAKRRGSKVGVGFLDLDHFKRINDSLGHPVGDVLLAQVAQRLSSQLRAGDTLARYAGDEFVVVWPDLIASDQEVVALSDRLMEALREPFDVGGISVTIAASVGIIVGDATQTVEDLLLAADAAMYDAKRHGRGRVRVFSNELRRGAQERMATEIGLRAALTKSELVLHYQPVIDLGTGRPVAVEALVRWQHPERGLLLPAEFISVAEFSGLIIPLGRWVLAQACRDAMDFTGPASGLDVAVNLSVRQLTQPDVLADVRRALASSQLDPQRLILEVTESAIMEDEEAAAVVLEELSRLGVRIAIDDFGTGYSSLLYVRRYPVSALKLDRAFVDGIDTNPDDEAICSSVVGLARAVGALSIAEGVETAEQHAGLRALGCEQAQGFLWSPAVSLADLDAALLACEHTPAPVSRRVLSNAVHPVEPDVVVRIAALERSGASAHTIAAALNRSTASNPTGRRWTASSVARHLSR